MFDGKIKLNRTVAGSSGPRKLDNKSFLEQQRLQRENRASSRKQKSAATTIQKHVRRLASQRKCFTEWREAFDRKMSEVYRIKTMLLQSRNLHFIVPSATIIETGKMLKLFCSLTKHTSTSSSSPTDDTRFTQWLSLVIESCDSTNPALNILQDGVNNVGGVTSSIQLTLRTAVSLSMKRIISFVTSITSKRKSQLKDVMQGMKTTVIDEAVEMTVDDEGRERQDENAEEEEQKAAVSQALKCLQLICTIPSSSSILASLPPSAFVYMSRHISPSATSTLSKLLLLLPTFPPSHHLLPSLSLIMTTLVQVIQTSITTVPHTPTSQLNLWFIGCTPESEAQAWRCLTLRILTLPTHALTTHTNETKHDPVRSSSPHSLQGLFQRLSEANYTGWMRCLDTFSKPALHMNDNLTCSLPIAQISPPLAKCIFVGNLILALMVKK